MLSWTIRLSPEAEEQLAELPRDQQVMIKRALERMKENPLVGNVKPLKGKQWKGVYRKPVGRYRIFICSSP